MSDATPPTQVRLPSTHSARRINALARRLGARRYLEIGVSKGNTFRAIEVAERTGVDPNFGFDTAEVANATTHLHAMRSDAWFAETSAGTSFDIVFIDGLHVFEQVVRDLTNTLARTSWRSAILIDDTVPVDVFSSLTSQRDAVRLREAFGGKSGAAWHGDVFKIVFLIHDFFPFLDYRTITGSGNPQTLVWRSGGITRKPLFDNVERISRLDWFALQTHADILQTTTEDEAIDLCVRAIEGQ